MTRPEDIPADVWGSACGFLPDLKGRPAPMPEEVAVALSRAILAERDRSEREVLTRIRGQLVEKRGDPRAYGQGFYDPLGPKISLLDDLLR